MSESRRLFFALPLPTKLQKQVIKWRADSFEAEAGRPVAAANLHLTLAFLGDVSDAKARVLSGIASRITSPTFSLTLDDLGHWPRPGVVWLGTRRAPLALLQLASLLRSHAARNGCYQSTLPFHPHVSLLRGATRPVALPASTPEWQLDANEFSLYESQYHQGRTRYQCLQSWPLVASSPC
ncbi:RNA 2',3'-cyclic phosphodiesterase [Rouxiella badensis]|jgi:2'-5' RNA ligase|uniref:RNA 2',3'-cyclic phosphodiesterase n=1 Tax=Rouxiella badensis TaxID=1646377 RepID=UPI0013EF077C|nr:RNA 2',3'-cyclic phosphodiesterase [Rouxiella badensis]MCC3704622.1 RNA 2',3'-cyclic phosphodiesterase [Rouxiella badensis]MCC3733061.1 RNA 2',3'-cyclic phosphodiesterase [Rouxiella badensis]MCC3746855.1 RNA 2',3'-cyclic phosphodiesterase [Rouxiella badensis]MCC3757493.1 RNA 2',3'-cyclic phosphodiesterase [Rouxiella badensis]QII39574.1 RNA 2',3'-cyclic phosphodiesterase [Rouxiella badensis]